MEIAIIGAGASGLVCAIAALRKAKKCNKNISVTIFERNDKVGKKILATGNGRCNMLNTNKDPFYFSKNNFHSCAINKFNAQSNIEFFESLGLYTRCDDEGRVYPLSNQAATVLDCLRFECANLGVVFETGYTVISIKKTPKGFIVNDSERFDKVVLACGGMASVKDFNGYNLLKMCGHKVTDINPSLSKLNTVDTGYVRQLQGIRHKTKLTLKRNGKAVAEEKGEILFAKYGISGIAVMQLSAYITREQSDGWTVFADFISEKDYNYIRDAIMRIISHNPDNLCENLLMGFMPKKLGEIVIKSLNIDLSKKIGSLSKSQINSIIKQAKSFSFAIASVRSYEDAQVTAGGADTTQFNDKTMESLICSGLYAIGELLDVDGLCGGYNLMWAWSSGRLCGENLLN